MPRRRKSYTAESGSKRVGTQPDREPLARVYSAPLYGDAGGSGKSWSRSLKGLVSIGRASEVRSLSPPAPFINQETPTLTRRPLDPLQLTAHKPVRSEDGETEPVRSPLSPRSLTSDGRGVLPPTRPHRPTQHRRSILIHEPQIT